MSRSLALRAIAIFSAMALIATACGGDDTVDDDTTVATSAPVATTEDSTTTTTTPSSTTTTAPDTTTTEPPPAAEAELVWTVEYEQKVETIAVSPDGATVVAGTDATYVHQLADGELVDVIVYRYSPAQIRFSPDGALLGAGLGVYGVALTTADGGDPPGLEDIRHFPDLDGAYLHGGYDNVVAFAPDGVHVATGNRDGVVWLWNASDGELTRTLEQPEADYVTGLAYHPSGTLLAATYFDCAVQVWDIATGTASQSYELNGSSCYGGTRLAFSPDGNVMAAAVNEGPVQFIRIWDVATGEQVVDFPMDVRNFDGLSFSPDSSMLVTAAWGMPPTVWDLASAAPLFSLDTGEDPGDDGYRPATVAFTPDGGHVAVGHWDGTVELWRLPGAEELVAPEREPCLPVPIPGDVLFDTGSAELKTAADDVLADLAGDLAAGFPTAALTFIGHTDSRGSAEANLDLSLARATAVRDWFEDWAATNEVDGWSLDVDGRGDTQLKVTDVDAEGNFLAAAGALNRRVEIEIDAAGCDS